MRHRLMVLSTLAVTLLGTACGGGATVAPTESAVSPDDTTSAPATEETGETTETATEAETSETPTEPRTEDTDEATEVTASEPVSATEQTEPTQYLDGNGLELVGYDDGQGASLRFGDPEDVVVGTMFDVYGQPTTDSGWVDAADSPFGVCPGATEGAQVRGVRWGRFEMLFSDAQTQFADAGERHLISYMLSAFASADHPAPTTREGIGLGSTWGQIRTTYGEAAELFPGDGMLPAQFRVLLDDGEIYGSLSDDDDEALVQVISAGTGCGE